MEKAPIRILLVENSPEEAFEFENTLSAGKSGEYAVHYASCLEQAHSRLSRESFDVMLINLSMPGVHALDTFDRINGRVMELPVIVVTSENNETIALDSMRRGAEDYLVRGRYDQAFLVRTIRYSMERHRIKRKLASVTRELKEVNSKLEKLTTVDPMTDTLNRRGLQQIFSRELDMARREEPGLLSLIINLDNFRQINQSLGHAAGDVVLQQISRRLKQALRVSDYIARVDGDEFVILLPQTRFAEGVRVAEKIRLNIAANPVSVNSGKAVHVTASLGLAMVSGETPSVEQLLSRSHMLLYQSKAGGKNCVAYEGAHGTEYVHDSGELGKIESALRDGRQFVALRQPIMNLTSNELVGYEFLSRSAIAGFEMPDDFFRFSIETNMLTEVDHHCFRACVQACRDLPVNAWRHVNLFPSTMMATPVQYLVETLTAHSEPERYCIEISEQQIIGEPSYLSESVHALKREGISIAIDDVGFGRSCLESLVVLEPHVVKIDKKWVIGIKHDNTRRRSLGRLLKVTQVLGCDVVAEGIESAEELEVLRDMGVTYGQGYYFGKPAAV